MLLEVLVWRGTEIVVEEVAAEAVLREKETAVGEALQAVGLEWEASEWAEELLRKEE